MPPKKLNYVIGYVSLAEWPCKQNAVTSYESLERIV